MQRQTFATPFAALVTTLPANALTTYRQDELPKYDEI